MVDELPRGKGSHRQLQPVDDRVEPALQQPDQVLGGIAAPTDRLLVVAVELLLADVAVVALELLLRHELRAVVGRLAPPLPVLTGAVILVVDRALRPSPEIDAE